MGSSAPAFLCVDAVYLQNSIKTELTIYWAYLWLSMAMAVRLSLTLFRFRSSSGCASVTFLRSARALFACASILVLHSVFLSLGIVVILLVERRSPVWNPTLQSRPRRILMELTECQRSSVSNFKK